MAGRVRQGVVVVGLKFPRRKQRRLWLSVLYRVHRWARFPARLRLAFYLNAHWVFGRFAHEESHRLLEEDEHPLLVGTQRFLARHLPSDATVLDLGCGNGIISSSLSANSALVVETVDVVSLEAITESEAMAAGFSSLASLRSKLLQRAEGEVYRVRRSWADPDPRIALRENIPEGTELDLLLRRLASLDARAGSGPWTRPTLGLIHEKSGERAAGLAEEMGMDKPAFKANVRKLKGLGLTESLKVGYLSPRGEAVLASCLAGVHQAD